MATSTRPSSPINVDIEVEHAIPVPPPSTEYFQVHVERVPTPYPSSTSITTASQLNDDTRAAVLEQAPIDPVCCDSLLIGGSGRTCNKDTEAEGDILGE